MASNEELSRRGHTYGPTTVYDSILHQGDNIYLSNETRKINCRDELLLKDPFIYRESLKNDKGERAPGTCEWIRENEIYRSWLEGDEQRLWIRGGPGKGKTMLSIFLTEELERKQHEREDNQDTTLLYFFCTNGNENYNNAIAVLRGLAYQLLNKHPDISTSVASYFETAKHTENTLSSPETLWMVFKTLLRAPKLGTVYCILDGLDECDEKSIGKLVKQFRDFYSASDHAGLIAQNLKLAIVSRKLNGLEDFPKIRLDPDNDNLINEDIKRFISTAMQELSRQPCYDDDFLRDIENILLRRSNGTFLWIGFVMKELLDTSTRMEVMDVLNALPQGLPAMYNRMLLQIKSSQRHIISAILKCVTIARRPMTLEELKTAVSLLCNTPIDSTQIMCDRIASCGPILQISSEGQDTCSLVHQSARDYFLREEADNNPILEKFRIKGKEAHTSLAKICFACIENSDLRHRPLDIANVSVLKKSPLLGYATKYWPEHARHADEDLEFSKAFFQKKNDVWKHWWQAHRNAVGSTYNLVGDDRPLHIASYLGIDSLVRKMLQANARRISLKSRKYVNQRNKYDMTPLILAAQEGHHSVVQLLLANGADVNANMESPAWDCTPLGEAATRGHLSVVQLLLANDADLKLPGNDMALHHAAENGHAAIVQLLLTKGADTNLAINRRGKYVGTPLCLAASNGHEAAVRLLLENGVDIMQDDRYPGIDGLSEAVRGGHWAIVQLLIDFNMKHDAGRDALYEAIRNGHKTTLQLLFSTKRADVNVQNNSNRLAPNRYMGTRRFNFRDGLTGITFRLESIYLIGVMWLSGVQLEGYNWC
ncbi:hypothetical protein CFAM422_006879 [Trichoderma lentiforme]|uniref:NACHT domain-containing protein n=1 Tax=Trichoderma lentiforme TaxID=1567552 RepID=A0A9P4XE25_9HYPO|nr:hypothetical protein CFAM422_006879 [Trichoderma lentiforme]